MYQSKLTEGNNSFEQTNEHVLQELMSSYGQQIQQLAYTYVKDPALAEDLTQEIFLKAYTKLHTYNGEASMKTWLYRIAINHCKDYVKSWHYRKVTLHAPAIDTAKTKGHSLEQEVINRSEQERIVQAVLQLPIKYRESVYLYYYEDLTTLEISRINGINENTIKTRLKRARKMIKKALEKEEST